MSKQTSLVDQDVGIMLREIVRAEVYRGKPDAGGYGEPEVLCVNDLIVNTGRATTGASAMVAMAVGTGSVAPALTDGTTPGLYGEVKRKALAINSAITNNVYTAVVTLGGAADSVTSVQIQEAGVTNSALSGQGTLMQRVTFSAVTLADSDLLHLTLQTNVGSNTF